MTRQPLPPSRARSHGFGLVEIMVGITIGLLALLIVYQVLSLAEAYRRTTTAGGDAQSTGMISTFIVAQELASGGNTVSDSAAALAACPSTGDFTTTWRPIPVLIRDGGADEVSDSFAVFSGANRRLVTPLGLTSEPGYAGYVPGGDIKVQSPLGFHPSHAGESPHLFVLTDAFNNVCDVGTVTPWPPAYDAATGIATFRPAGPGFANAYPQRVETAIVNLGASDRVRKVRYDVAGDVLRSTDLLVAGAVPNPIASNVVLMKVQYGIDTDGDTFVDRWVSARNAPWDEASVLDPPGAASATERRAVWRSIKAIRLALVVRSSQFERLLDAEGRDAVGKAALQNDFRVTLFSCNGMPQCSGELPNIVIPGTANHRYRVFEQVIPLQNQIWNPS